ncbi:MAG: heat-inducible transcriptional repressor HrcA [Actinomycetota bacterium]|nr:heat-inducible transcriptional repressor HrcA [Actinomycetota bacterium]MDD5665830.1 heat-inducible transcriptional repressor HrcA [Actinomycetota bacterium]
MLDKRQQKILKTVVYKFITTGAPVGSKSLAQHLNLGISAATIRNELSKLEGMGYLFQPHTSAGRVPTDLGYRFYVDSLSGRTRLRQEEKSAIITLFSHKTKELEGLLQETSTLLSRLTSAAAMVIAPRLRRTNIKHVDLVNLAEDIVLLVIITDTGRVEKKLIDVKDSEETIDLDEIQSFLNHNLQGKGLEKVADLAFHPDVGKLKSPLLTARAISVIRDILTEDEYEKVYVGGTANLLRYLDSEGLKRIENLLEHFEEQYFLLNMLGEALGSKELMVRIGDENLYKELQSFSLVATPYAIGEEMVGTVSVLGSTRMDYARVIPTVDFIAKSLSRTLEMLKG